MGIGDNLSDSFGYAQEGLVGKWTRWIVLLIGTIIFPIMSGYTLRVMKGITPAPEAEGFLDLFIDGIKIMIISFVYMIIPLIILFASAGAAIMGMIGGEEGSASLGMLGAAAGGMIVFIIVAFVFGLFATIGMVRFARTDAMGEAFNFGEILAVIGRIGWLNYILALIVLWIVLCVIQGILSIIPIIGWLILFIISPLLSIVIARYISNLYDQGTN